MDASTTAAAAVPARGAVIIGSHASPELRRVQANIRVLVAIVATTEAVSLPGAARTPAVVAALGYTAYAGWLCWVELNGNRPALSRLTAWIDATWILLFAWLATAQSSLFVLLLLFPVLFASLSFGFVSGMLVSLFAAAGAATELVIHGDPGGVFAPGAILQPLLLLVLGPLVAGLARAGVQMSEQLTIADHLLAEADPRLGVERVATTMLQSLTGRFEADLGLILLWLPDSEPRLFHCDGRGKVSELSDELRASLLESLAQLPPGIAAVHHLAQLFGRVPIRYHCGFDLATKSPSAAARPAAEHVAELLDARSLIAIPICRRAPHPCRLLLESRRRRYRSRDVDVLCSVMEQFAPVIENAGLLERLTEEAMTTERARIGRDLHDTAIQPYLGLKYGIEALARKATADNPLHRDIHALREIATRELHELRELVTGMRSSGARRIDDTIGPALRRQAKRFSELFGMEVSVSCPDDLPICRQLATAVFPIVSEALTNIRRHTNALRAEIEVSAQPDAYMVRISNARGDADSAPTVFVPRSIVERAESVQGCAVVDLQRPGFTDLIVSIPKSS